MKSIKLALMAAFWFALAFTFSCSSGGGGSLQHEDDGLVNAKNEAWVLCNDGECYGYVFKQNGELNIYYENGNRWELEDSYYYSVKGNKITTCDYDYDDCEDVSYSISGNKLTIKLENGKKITFTRTNVYINGGGGGSSSPGGKSSSGGSGSRLVNCQFEEDGDTYCIDKSEDYAFTYDECLDYDGIVVSSCKNVGLSSSLVGDVSSSSRGGGGLSSSGGVVINSNIVNANNEAWVACYTNCYGSVFKQNGEFIDIYREKGGSWCISNYTGNYSVKGNQLTLCYYFNDGDNRCDVNSFSISGNELTIINEDGYDLTYTRTSDVNISNAPYCEDDD